MSCPVCNQRKAKRACPALGKRICAVCCGTKRVVEIACPADCGYLTSARMHPPAVVQRQQDLDRAMMLPLLQNLTERQARLFLMMGAVAARHGADALQKIVDEDIAQAAGSLAATLETASRGILYEHQPQSLAATRLRSELRNLVDDVVKNAGSGLERDAAIALRRLEHGAQAMAALRPESSEFQQLLTRALTAPSSADTPGGASSAASPIIIP